MPKNIIIDGIEAIATRDPNTCSYLKWSIAEKTTGLSLMPPSWPGSESAETLEGAISIVRRHTIEPLGLENIKRIIKSKKLKV